ncbi:MAG: hypothetical protein K2N66_00260 [Paramuribaculum sp.]|nr:hypothetical protein [Paramuribaculum sp.]
MNKKMFVPAAIAAMMGVGAYFGNATATPAEGLSDLQLENAEALADDTETPCDVFTGGFKQWSLSGLFRVKQSFYDCCGVLREGYNPKGLCN